MVLVMIDRMNTRFMGKVCFYVISISVLLLFFSTDSFAADKKIPSGITVGDIDASGMTEEELRNSANEYVTTFTSKIIRLEVDGNEVDVTAGDLGYYWKNKEIIDEAVQYCHEGNVIERYKYGKDVAKKGVRYDFDMDVDDEVMEATLRERCSVYNVPHVNATLTKNGDNFDISPEAKGKRVDIESGVSDIHDYLLNQWDGNEAERTLKMVEDLPTSTSADCAKVKDMIGTFSTSFSASSANYSRNKNLENGINLLNGITVGVGETISVNSYLEPWTPANGWYEGGTYVNGRVENSLGGGICQVSTTLYNAALNAELDIVERACHSMTVGYVPLSMDAALAGTWKDLKIRNNTDTPIYIEGIYGAGRLTFNIYGVETRPENRSVQYSSQRVSSGSSYYKSQLVKRVYVDGVLQSESVVNSSTYSNGGGYTGSRVAQTKPGQEPQQPETVQISGETTSEEVTTEMQQPQTTQQLTVPAAQTVQTPTTTQKSTERATAQRQTTSNRATTTQRSTERATTQKQTTTRQVPTTQPTTVAPSTTQPVTQPVEPEQPTTEALEIE